MVERVILNVHLRGAQPGDAVHAALARGLSVARDAIVGVDADDAAAAPVLLEQAVADTKRSRAFRTTVSTYVDPAQVAAVHDDVTLARLLARELLVDALAPLPEGDDPYRWLLVKPDGRAFVVSQTLEGDELADDVVVDDSPSALVPWS